MQPETSTSPGSFNDSKSIIDSEEHVVLVLGAGASISEMANSKGATSKKLPPTDIDFLTKANALCKRFHTLEQLFDDVWGTDAPYPLKYQRMEQLFAATYYEVLQTKGTTKAGIKRRELMDELVWTLRDTLLETTNLASPRQHLQLLEYLVSRSRKVSIISFNYDLLCDRALRNGDGQKLWTWTHKDGYGFRPSKQPIPKKPSDIMLYKLHGSMHWYIDRPSWRRDAAYNPKKPVYLPRPATNKKAAAWHRRQLTLGRTKKPIFPLIIPPVYEKGDQVHKVISQVWSGAKESLRSASAVVVWGYSLPVTDYHAEILFASAARRSHSRLVVINPSKEALSRVTCVAGHRWNRWFFKIEHLLRVLND